MKLPNTWQGGIGTRAARSQGKAPGYPNQIAGFFPAPLRVQIFIFEFCFAKNGGEGGIRTLERMLLL